MNRKRLALIFAMAGIAFAAGMTAQDRPDPKKRIGRAGGPAIPQRTKAAPDTYGTTATSYYRIGFSEFTELDTNIDGPHSDFWYDQPGDIFRRYSTVPNGYFVATPHLPSGARVTYMELDACDTSGDASTVSATLYDCDYLGNCNPVGTATALEGLCASSSSSDLATDIVVDNFFGELVVRVSTDAGTNTTTLAGVILGYVLQVSPAPGTATFPDVPTSDFGFQYIEALVASGITGGCGGGLYCPDSPVTRRQMAIFIAKALGLHWE